MSLSGVTDTMWPALLALRRRPGRFLLIGLPPLLGVVAILGAVVLAEKERIEADQAFAELGRDILVAVVDDEAEAPRWDNDAIRRLEGVGTVLDVAALGAVTSAPATGSVLPGLPEVLPIPVFSVAGDFLAASGAQVVGGRFLSPGDGEHPVVVLGTSAAERRGVWEAGATVHIGDHRFTVVGIIEPGPRLSDLSESILMTPDAAQRWFDGREGFTRVVVHARPGYAAQTARLLPSVLGLGGDTVVSVLTTRQLSEGAAVTESAITALGVGISVLVLVVGAVLIGSTMRSTVLGRSRQIGIRLAMGHSRGAIAAQFVIEGAIIGLAGATAGILVMVGFVFYLESGGAIGLGARVGFRLPLASAMLAILVSTLASSTAAAQAARIDPADTMRFG